MLVKCPTLPLRLQAYAARMQAYAGHVSNSAALLQAYAARMQAYAGQMSNFAAVLRAFAYKNLVENSSRSPNKKVCAGLALKITMPKTAPQRGTNHVSINAAF